jgi:hypothetical protein
MHKNFSSDRKVLEDAIHEVTKIYPPEGQLWVDSVEKVSHGLRIKKVRARD